jgi:predicted nucleic acid-binding protein
MATDGRSDAIIDSSKLVNFLKIDRADLLASHPGYRFIVVDAVRNEVTKYYPAQVARLEAAFAAGQLFSDQPAAATSIAELAAFAAMASIKIGVGERAAIAAAKTRGLPLAMDDERAWKRAASGLSRLDTMSVMVALIKAGVVDVGAADAIKSDWESNHKFIKKHFSSFAELIP